jgi:hypothetical protein
VKDAWQRLLIGVVCLSATRLDAQPAPRVTTALPAAELRALETIRKDVWVNWFSGDTAALRRVLAPELVAIGGDGPHWETLDQTISSSAEFRKSGGKFVSITFDSALTHRFGETVVMFAHYAVTTERDGKRSTRRGRVTEVFVRAQGKWVHTSWHIDAERDT